MSKSYETTIDRLPEKNKQFVIQNVANTEEMISCVLIEITGFFGGLKTSVVALTNYKLLCSDGSVKYRSTNDYRLDYIISLVNIKEVRHWSSASHIYVYYESGGSTYDFVIDFFQKELSNKFAVEIKKAAANATTPLQTQAKRTIVSDLADQLIKLAELYRTGAITELEYQAAKQKLLL
jgi:hypothetical protein